MHDPDDVARWQAEVLDLVAGLPETVTSESGAGHTFKVRKKTFAHLLVDHHGDDRVGLWFKAAPGVQQELLEVEADRFYVPPYLGPHGWVALDLEAAPVERAELAQTLDDAWRLAAPKTVVARRDAERAAGEAGDP
mgnify:CR=1 FL=1